LLSAAGGLEGVWVAGFSVVTLSFDDLVIIVGFAAGFSSEYSGPPMLSSTTLDSPVLDSPALAFGFTIGVACLPAFGFSTLVFFGGTAGSPSSTVLASSGALQQLNIDRRPPRFFFFFGGFV
jgi:hypothetical protein